MTKGGIFPAIYGTVFLVIIIVIAIVVLPPLLAPQPANSSAVPPGIVVLVVAVVIGIIAFTVLRSRRKLTGLTGSVLHTEGPAHTRAGYFTNDDSLVGGEVYRLKVGSVTFALSTQSQLDGFADGSAYRVHYVKGTLPIILSAEDL